MSVLLAIGRFFKKIWDWIKQTAWIQPLLIVGIIFGVITSIRPIIDLAKTNKAKRNEYNTFFTQYRISLKDAAEGKSEADVLTSGLYDIMNSSGSKQENAVNSFKESYEEICGKKCGNKFFIAYVAKDCANCADAKDAFAYFKDNLLPEGDEFNLVTIFGDEEKYSDSEPEDTPFYNYCLEHQDFFESVAAVASGSDYYFKEKISISDLTALQEGDNTVILTPTIFLVELGEDIINKGVTEVMVGIPGDDKYEKAQQLADCWSHKGDFSTNEGDEH